jgi:hypothetical protein
MTDDERRLLLACAACILANLTGEGPRVETQIKVLNQMLEPFRDFMRDDAQMLRRKRADV